MSDEKFVPEWFQGSTFRRLLWLPIAPVVLCAAFMYVMLSFIPVGLLYYTLWRPLVWAVSWVIYGNHLILGHYAKHMWITSDTNDARDYDFYVSRARENRANASKPADGEPSTF